MLKEIWECIECGSPCRVEIDYEDDKLPEHLKEKTRFLGKDCLCRSSPSPHWRRVTEQADSSDRATVPCFECGKVNGGHYAMCSKYQS